MPSPAPAPPAPSVALVGHLVPGAAARSAARWLAGLGWGLAAVLAWSGGLPAALLVALLALPLALVLAPLGSGDRVRGGLVVGAGGLVLGGLVSFAATRSGWTEPDQLRSIAVPPWVPVRASDVVALVVAALVGLALCGLLASIASRHDPADRLRLAALVGCAYAAGEGLVRLAPLLGAGGQGGTDPVPWLLLTGVAGLATPAVYAGAVALAVAGAGSRPVVRWAGAALVWGGYAGAAYGLGFVGSPALALLLTGVLGWFLAGTLSLGIAGNAPATGPEAATGPPRAPVRALRLGAVVLVLLAAAGLVFGARTPVPAAPTPLDAAAAAGAGGAPVDVGDGVRLAVPTGWTVVGTGSGQVWLTQADGLRARVEVVRQPLDAVPYCEQLVREAPRHLLATRSFGCHQGPIVGKLDTAGGGGFAGLYAGPQAGARVVDSLGVGHRFDGLSVVVGVLGAGTPGDEGGRRAQAGSALYAAALAALDAAPATSS